MFGGEPLIRSSRQRRVRAHFSRCRIRLNLVRNTLVCALSPARVHFHFWVNFGGGLQLVLEPSRPPRRGKFGLWGPQVGVLGKLCANKGQRALKSRIAHSKRRKNDAFWPKLEI